MSDQIPLDYTVTFSGLPSVFDSTLPPSDVAGIPPITPDTVFPLEKVGQGGPDGTYNVTAGGLKDWLLAGLGNIREWVVDEFYFATRMDVSGTILYPPDIISHDNSLYVVLQDFQAGATFDERPEGVVLDRISKDSDLQYNEITAAAFEPFVSGQVLGQYTSLRRFSIIKEHAFPNANISAARQYHVALCNSSIDSPVVVDIKRRNSTTGIRTIGTITFTPSIDDPHQTVGVIEFNDIYNAGSQFATLLFFEENDSLFFTLNTTSPTLEWLSINLLGTFVNYVSPYFNMQV